MHPRYASPIFESKFNIPFCENGLWLWWKISDDVSGVEGASINGGIGLMEKGLSGGKYYRIQINIYSLVRLNALLSVARMHVWQYTKLWLFANVFLVIRRWMCVASPKVILLYSMFYEWKYITSAKHSSAIFTEAWTFDVEWGVYYALGKNNTQGKYDTHRGKEYLRRLGFLWTTAKVG